MLQHKLQLLLTSCSELVFFSLIILLRETDITDKLVRPDFTHILDTDLMQLASTVVTHNEPTAAVHSVMFTDIAHQHSQRQYMYSCPSDSAFCLHFAHLLGTLCQTMFLTPKVIVIFLSKLKTHY